MQYKMKASLFKGEWIVEAINEEGERYIAAFSGPEAKERAIAYATWMKSPVRGDPHSLISFPSDSLTGSRPDFARFPV